MPLGFRLFAIPVDAVCPQSGQDCTASLTGGHPSPYSRQGHVLGGVMFKSIAPLAAALALAAAQFFNVAVAQEKVTVRDSWTPTGVQAGWHWGLEKGIFK